MRLQEIHQVGMRERVRVVPIRNSYSLRPEKGFVWLQRLCFAVLEKIGCIHMSEVRTVTRFTIDSDKFIKRIFESVENIHEMFDREPRHMLVGAEDMKELMSVPPTDVPYEFMTEYYKDGRIMGMKVRVIPWMRGFVLLLDDPWRGGD